MKRLLRRVALKVILYAVGIVVLPLVLFLIWWSVRSHELPSVIATPRQAILAIITLTVLLCSVALLIAYRAVNSVVDIIGPPLLGLIEDADRLDEGVTRRRRSVAPTGVWEIDQLTASLTKGSHQASKRLAAERDFAADASHQLRTPLTALLMRLEEIASTDDLAVVAEESQIAIAQVERLSGVVDDLLARSRSGVDKTPSVALDTVLASLQREWQHAFASARRTIRVTGERGLRVKAAPGALAQIFSTLFENALSHGAGTLTVAARRVGPSVVIEVSDQGEGISPALAPHVFERSVSSTGSGLGLTLARDLAAAQGGRLELVEAGGAAFALFLSEATD